MENKFDRTKHVYRNDDFAELLKDAMRFFHGTPVFGLPPPESFVGSGIYALYHIGREGVYKKFGETINRVGYSVPIYVGKAVPSGWRQSRVISENTDKGKSLHTRLAQHAKSITAAKNLELADFACRFMIFEGEAQNMIPSVEAALVSQHNPLWNSVVDGFGNHDPGKGRHAGRISAWDALHPGRAWTSNITGERPDVKDLKRRITDYLVGLR
ncbi:MAG: Eco29kI family restriction endonuclease [Kiritimatiellaeota bacterium]|nr:Eco29kI family restriction endonuclease [Kiritimatiellota bacterium]